MYVSGENTGLFFSKLALRAGIEPALAVPETAVLSVERSKHQTGNIISVRGWKFNRTETGVLLLLDDLLAVEHDGERSLVLDGNRHIRAKDTRGDRFHLFFSSNIIFKKVTKLLL